MKKILILSLLIIGCTPTQPPNNKKNGNNKQHTKNKTGNKKNKQVDNNNTSNTDTGTAFITPPSAFDHSFPMMSTGDGCTVGVIHFDCSCSSLDTSRVKDTLRVIRK